LIEFLSHDLDLLRFWLEGDILIENVRFSSSDPPGLGRRAYRIHLALRYGPVPVEIDAVPLFDAPWLWKESFEIVYPRDLVSIAFGNPFSREADTGLVRERKRAGRSDATRIFLGSRDATALELEWVAAELRSRPPDLGPAREAAEVVELVERCFRHRLASRTSAPMSRKAKGRG
jgi:predicted dehydrogenase